MFKDDVEDYFVEQEPEEVPVSMQSEVNDSEQKQGSRTIAFAEVESVQSQDNASVSTKNVRRFPSWIIKIVAAIFIIGAIICYFRYFSPIVDSAVLDGSVENVQRRGMLFKTFEAEIVDRGKIVPVSIVDESVFLKLQSHQSSGQIVRVNYCKYTATLPWRGESEIVVTDVVDR